MYTFLVEKLGKALTWLIIFLLVVMVVGVGYTLVKSFFTKDLETQVRLERNTAGANLDAVEVANEIADDVNKTAEQIDGETKELVNEVLSAPPGNSNPAAVRAICGMRAYRDRSECAGVRAGGAAVAPGANTSHGAPRG